MKNNVLILTVLVCVIAVTTSSVTYAQADNQQILKRQLNKQSGVKRIVIKEFSANGTGLNIAGILERPSVNDVIVLFVQDNPSAKIYLAKTGNMNPAIYKFNDDPYMRTDSSRWSIRYVESKSIREIIAFSFTLLDEAKYTFSRDAKNLDPITRRGFNTIEELIKTFSYYGWKPTGLTYGDPRRSAQN